MPYVYRHFIPQNIAPKDATKIGVYNSNDEKIFTIPLGRLSHINETKLYSFGLLSDIHMTGDSEVGTKEKDGNGLITDGFYFRRALEFFKNQKCDLVCISGDLTDIGFWKYKEDTPTSKATYYLYYPNQFAEYKSICDIFADDFPIYSCCGNHESYTKDINGIYDDKWESTWTEKSAPYEQIDTIEKLKYYTGTPLYYTISSNPTTETTLVEGSVNVINNGGNIYADVGNDVFIMFGQPSPTANSSWTNQIDWLEATLEANKNKRCFVFEHLTLNMDSGNPENVHNAYWGSFENRLVSILNSHKNVILFHGHSHMQFQEQVNVSYANYSTERGFKSVHIPSTSYTRYMVDKNGDGVWNSGDKDNLTDGAQGYICDVYQNYIVLRGYDFQYDMFVPIAQYRINTTFTDSTGTITT
jgi:3',5'-cyclic AMP phosphodiesterase CpdA